MSRAAQLEDRVATAYPDTVFMEHGSTESGIAFGLPDGLPPLTPVIDPQVLCRRCARLDDEGFAHFLEACVYMLDLYLLYLGDEGEHFTDDTYRLVRDDVLAQRPEFIEVLDTVLDEDPTPSWET